MGHGAGEFQMEFGFANAATLRLTHEHLQHYLLHLLSVKRFQAVQ